METEEIIKLVDGIYKVSWNVIAELILSPTHRHHPGVVVEKFRPKVVTVCGDDL